MVILKRINKILSTQNACLIAVVYILFFLFLSSGKELLHNHKPDEFEHDNCPAFTISQSFSSGIIIHFDLQNEFIVESEVKTLQVLQGFQQKPVTKYLRGPPLF